jgi:hypothetical protein
MLDAERIHARKKLTETEKELSQVIYEQTGGNQDFALIRSKGDHTICGKSAQAMKVQWKVPVSRHENLPTAKPHQTPLLLWMSAYPMHSTWPNWSMQIPCNRTLRA